MNNDADDGLRPITRRLYRHNRNTSSQQLTLQKSLRLRRFDTSHNTQQRRNVNDRLNDVVDVDEDELKPLLWNMLYLACLGVPMNEIQENPILVRYVDNMFDHVDGDGDINNIRLPRLGVIADWRHPSGDSGSGVGGSSTSSNSTTSNMTRGVGAAWIQCWNPKSGLSGYGTIRDDIPELTIAVLPEYQGRGIGQAMLQELISYAREHQQSLPQRQLDCENVGRAPVIPAISLSVQSDNVHAVRLYQRLGFVKEPGSDYTNEEGKTWYAMVRWF